MRTQLTVVWATMCETEWVTQKWHKHCTHSTQIFKLRRLGNTSEVILFKVSLYWLWNWSSQSLTCPRWKKQCQLTYLIHLPRAKHFTGIISFNSQNHTMKEVLLLSPCHWRGNRVLRWFKWLALHTAKSHKAAVWPTVRFSGHLTTLTE